MKATKKKIQVLQIDEVRALKSGVANRKMRRSLAKKTGEILEVTQKPMSYAKKNMTVHKHPTQYNQLCSKCLAKPRQNGSSRCAGCSLKVKK